MKRITLHVQDLEVEKPSGGGKGAFVPYIVEVLIDGRLAFTLRRNDFKETGQMDAFVQIVRES